MKHVIALLLCFVTFATIAQKAKKSSDRFAGLDTAFARVLKDWKAAGFAVTVGLPNKTNALYLYTIIIKL